MIDRKSARYPVINRMTTPSEYYPKEMIGFGAVEMLEIRKKKDKGIQIPLKR